MKSWPTPGPTFVADVRTVAASLPLAPTVADKQLVKVVAPAKPDTIRILED